MGWATVEGKGEKVAGRARPGVAALQVISCPVS